MIETCFNHWVKAVDAGTRERLLTAAERLLLESGYDAVSVRAVCTAAHVNPAAVHYHFGSKDALVSALLQARLGPLWQAPLHDLIATEDPSIAACVQIVVAPLRALSADPTGRLYLHLLARLFFSRRQPPWTDRWFTLDPWAQILHDNVPGLSPREARRRWMLAFELILGQFGDPLAGDRVLSDDAVAALHRFVTAGLSAPLEDQ